MKLKIVILLTSLMSANSLDYLNYIRKSAGASTLRYNKALGVAAKKHAIYLAKNKEYGHFENPNKPYFYARAPWQRIVKAGFFTKAVVENISFYEKSYISSINKIMATIYHRLAFLDLKVDRIGYSYYKGVYVYDMSNSKIANLCKQKFKRVGEFVENICKNGNVVPKSKFHLALNKTKKESKAIIIYPFNNQKNLPTTLAKESPSFTNRLYGLPISVCFNDSYFYNVKLKKLNLYNNEALVKGRVVTFRNDPNRKIPQNCFIFLPYKRLKRASLYKVVLEAKANNKKINKIWKFTTY